MQFSLQIHKFIAPEIFIQKAIEPFYVFTPSDAVMIECKLGMESALSIFTMT